MIDYRVFLHFENTKSTRIQRTHPFETHSISSGACKALHAGIVSSSIIGPLPSHSCSPNRNRFVACLSLSPLCPSHQSLRTKLHEFRFIFFVSMSVSVFFSVDFSLLFFLIVRSCSSTRRPTRALFRGYAVLPFAPEEICTFYLV